MAKDDFKRFVRSHPELITYVNSGKMSWQKFYEIYDLYGEDKEAWKEYLPLTNENTTSNTLDFISWLKNIDLDAFQNGVSSLQRVLGVVQDLKGNETNIKPSSEYKPRPMYKHFED